jgi:hypothetical protein
MRTGGGLAHGAKVFFVLGRPIQLSTDYADFTDYNDLVNEPVHALTCFCFAANVICLVLVFNL